MGTVRKFRIGAKHPHHLGAGHVGHANVEQNQSRPLLPDSRKRFRPARRAIDGIPAMPKVRGVDIRRVLEIIDQENERLWHRCRDIAIRERRDVHDQPRAAVVLLNGSTAGTEDEVCPPDEIETAGAIYTKYLASRRDRPIKAVELHKLRTGA